MEGVVEVGELETGEPGCKGYPGERASGIMYT